MGDDPVAVTAAASDVAADADAGARARSRWVSTRTEVILLVLLCLFVRAVAALANPAIEYDSVTLLRSAERLGREGFAALTTSTDHPLVPWLVATIAGAGREEQFGTWLAVAAGALAVWPLHVLARRACGRNAATAAAVLYAALPKAVGVATAPQTSAVLLPLFLGALALAVASGVRATQGRRWARIFGTGLLAGLAYLCRPEGLVAAVAAVLALLALVPRGWRLRAVAGATAAFLVVAAPYAAALSLESGHLRLSPKKDVARFVGTAQIVAEVTPKSLPVALRDAASGLEGALTLPVIGLLVLGAFPRRRWTRRHWAAPRALLLGSSVVITALVVRLGTGWGYGGARHLLPAALLVLPFAGEGLDRLSGFWRRVTSRRRMALVLAVLLAIPLSVRAVLRPEGEEQVGQRRLGEAVARTLREAGAAPQGTTLVVASFREPLVAYYADRALRPDARVEALSLAAHRDLLERVDTEGKRAALVDALRRGGARWLVLDLFVSEITPTHETLHPCRRLAARLTEDGVLGTPVVCAGGALAAFPVR